MHGLTAARAQCGSNCSLLFTGHSLGAAMATMAAADLTLEGEESSLFTFGSPRVGNSEFKSWAQGRLSTSMRMRRQLDIVPAIPPRGFGFDYEHVAHEIWNKHADGEPDSYVMCDGSGEDPNCGDSEETPPFPLDLLHLKPSEHTRYMGYHGGGCAGGHNN